MLTFLQSSTHRMELVIIALIAVEVVIVRVLGNGHLNFHLLILCAFLFQALIRDGPELWQMVFGPSHIEDKISAPHS